MQTHICRHTYVLAQVCTRTSLHTQQTTTHTHAYRYSRTHTHTHTHILTYTHTHIHTHTAHTPSNHPTIQPITTSLGLESFFSQLPSAPRGQEGGSSSSSSSSTSPVPSIAACRLSLLLHDAKLLLMRVCWQQPLDSHSGVSACRGVLCACDTRGGVDGLCTCVMHLLLVCSFCDVFCL
jgi:hypothetical protein